MGRKEMKITPDTTILVRALLCDDVKQGRVAARLFKEAELIAICLSSLCEFVWVLRRVYSLGVEDISSALEALLDAGNVVVNRPAVDAGLAILHEGGDFADGIIAYEGSWLGGETFVSFDRRAVALLSSQGQQAKLLT
jgi:predicted nucleic-acid-binding protein